VALSLTGLKHAMPHRHWQGLISFVRILGSLTGLAVATFVAVAQFWPELDPHFDCPWIFLRRPVSGGLRVVAYFVGGRQLESRLGDVRAIRFGYLFGFVGF